MINFEKIPIKDGLLFCLDGEDYDNSEKWGPNITIKNGEIAKDHSVYLKKNSNANLQGSLQIKFNNTFFFSLYMIVKFDFNETNYSYYYINDRNVLYIYTSPKQENQNNTRISLGGHEIKLNLDLTKYHLIALSLSPRTTQIMVDGKIYTSYSPGYSDASIYGSTLYYLSDVGPFKADSSNSIYFKHLSFFVDNHNRYAAFKNSLWLMEQYQLEIPKDIKSLEPVLPDRKESLLQAYVLENNNIEHELFLKTINAYKGGYLGGIEE